MLHSSKIALSDRRLGCADFHTIPNKLLHAFEHLTHDNLLHL